MGEASLRVTRSVGGATHFVCIIYTERVFCEQFQQFFVEVLFRLNVRSIYRLIASYLVIPFDSHHSKNRSACSFGSLHETVLIFFLSYFSCLSLSIL